MSPKPEYKRRSIVSGLVHQTNVWLTAFAMRQYFITQAETVKTYKSPGHSLMMAGPVRTLNDACWC